VSGSRPPSPWLFLLALLLGMAALELAGRASASWTYTPLAADYFGTGRLQRFRPAGPLRVAAVGSSVVARGLLFDEDMEAMGRALGRPLRFVRFSHGGRRLDMVPALLARLAAQPPDLLVMEAEWLVWGEPPERPYWVRRDRERRLFRALLGAAMQASGRLRPAQAGQDENRPGAGDLAGPALPLPAFDPGVYAGLLRQVTLQDRAMLSSVLAGLERLQRGGCRVVILSFGRSPAAAAMEPPGMRRADDQAMQDLAARGFRVVRQDCPLRQDDYLDHGHLTILGQRRFSAWFLAHLGAWAEDLP